MNQNYSSRIKITNERHGTGLNGKGNREARGICICGCSPNARDTKACSISSAAAAPPPPPGNCTDSRISKRAYSLAPRTTQKHTFRKLKSELVTKSIRTSLQYPHPHIKGAWMACQNQKPEYLLQRRRIKTEVFIKVPRQPYFRYSRRVKCNCIMCDVK